MSLQSRQRGLKFLQKLWDAATYNEDGSIFWNSSGHSIIFQLDFLEKYCSPDGKPLCQTTNLASFLRILNSFGFRKVRNSKRDLHGKPSATIHLQYSRDFFQRGRSDLLSLIERKKAKPKADGRRSQADTKQRSKLMHREKVVKKRLPCVEAARRNFRNVVTNSLKAYKNGDKDNFLQKSMTSAGIETLCEETSDTIVHVTSRVVVMKVQQNEDANVLSLVEVEVPKGGKKVQHLVGEWNAKPVKEEDIAPRASREVVVEYEEKF